MAQDTCEVTLIPETRQQSPASLLTLPVELQLTIFELTVIEDETIFLNCPCDSSYQDDDDWSMDKSLWETGEKHPPFQPGLTQTCKAIRAIALPLFYERNVFRAHYCYAVDVDMAIGWLRCIGQENRSMLKDLAFHDKNPVFDRLMDGKDLKKLRRGELCKRLGGRLETTQERFPCHQVTFVEREEAQYEEAIADLFEM
jgi:hypothetical protein